MQHEHGYPNHFFNMTRQGIVKVFEGKARLLKHTVPNYGLPIYTLCAYVQEYSSSLPAAARAEFQNLTIKDIELLPKDQYGHKSYVQQLSAEGNWKLASVTAALFERGAAKIAPNSIKLGAEAATLEPEATSLEPQTAKKLSASLLPQVKRKLDKLRRDPAAFFADAKLKPLRRLKALF